MRYTYPGLIDFEMYILPEAERTLVFTIHEQDSSIDSACTRRDFEFFASNRIQIKSIGHIELSGREIFLRGTNRSYGSTVSRTFAEASYCRERLEEYLQAFEELAASKGIYLQGSVKLPEQLSLWD